MSIPDSRRQSERDATFRIGDVGVRIAIAVFVIGIGGNLLAVGRILQKVDDLKTDMDAYKTMPPRVAVTEARIDGIDTRVKLIESHYGIGLGSTRDLNRYDTK